MLAPPTTDIANDAVVCIVWVECSGMSVRYGIMWTDVNPIVTPQTNIPNEISRNITVLDFNTQAIAGGALQRHVVSHLTHGTRLENRGRDYLVNLRIQDAVYRSHETGCRIERPGDEARGATRSAA